MDALWRVMTICRITLPSLVMVQLTGLEFAVQGLGFRVLGFGFWVLGFGFLISGFGFWVLGIRVLSCRV